MSPLVSDPALEDFRAAIGGPDEEIDLARVALESARIEYPDLDIAPHLARIDEMARVARSRMTDSMPVAAQIEELAGVVLLETEIRGATDDYYNPSNSLLNDILTRKLGIPVSLSVLFMSVGARAGIALGGTSVPMHFLVRALGIRPPLFVDCFNGGRLLTLEECTEALRTYARGRIAIEDSMFDVVPNSAVIARLLLNLKIIYLNRVDWSKAVLTINRLMVIAPEESSLLRERGLALYRLGDGEAARQDLIAYLDDIADPPDAPQIRKLLRKLGGDA